MADLIDSRARRGGATARRWHETVENLNLSAAGAIRIKFSITGNNHGETEVEVDIGPNDFSTLVETMCIVDRQAAMAAMSVELARQVHTQPERDARVMRSAQNELQELARQKFHEKPYGEDENERIVMEGLDDLTKELSGK